MIAKLTRLTTLALLLPLGCGEAARFPPHALAMAEQQIVPDHEEQIAAVLEKLFGTPGLPIVPESLADLLDENQLRRAAGQVSSTQPGQSLGLYRRHCAVCHGLSGDGQGPAALYEAPYPRDFREGVFKFKSTYRGAAPTDADLAATLRSGSPGTAMPSFELLSVDEIGALVQYVKYLATRGEVEQALARHVGEEFDFDPVTRQAGTTLDLDDDETRELVYDEILPRVARRWRDASAMVVPAVVPDFLSGDQPAPAAVEAGRQLFHDVKRANCVKCHGQDGEGGASLVDYNDWNKRTHEFLQQTQRLVGSRQTLRERLAQTEPDRRALIERELAELNAQIKQRTEFGQAMLPPREADPRRLIPGSLRGARSSQDLYRLISQGVAGTPMPAVGAPDPNGEGALTPEEIWQLVAYVEHLTTDH